MSLKCSIFLRNKHHLSSRPSSFQGREERYSLSHSNWTVSLFHTRQHFQKKHWTTISPPHKPFRRASSCQTSFATLVCSQPHALLLSSGRGIPPKSGTPQSSSVPPFNHTRVLTYLLPKSTHHPSQPPSLSKLPTTHICPDSPIPTFTHSFIPSLGFGSTSLTGIGAFVQYTPKLFCHQVQHPFPNRTHPI